MLMSHSDVVEAEGKWKHHPFSGYIDDERVWGRGTQDTKGSLCGILEATELLIESGFKPEVDVYILTTHDEEIMGIGAKKALEYFKDKNKYKNVFEAVYSITEPVRILSLAKINREISTEDAAVLVEALKKGLKKEGYEFYVGTSYRHCLIWDKGSVVELTPPHDVLTQVIGQHLPQDEVLRAMMKKSYDVLVNHPINVERKKQGLNPANCCWFWGAGTKPMLSSFEEKTGKKGLMVSAVDLLKGIAVGAGMGTVEVEGANGGLHTNYAGKVDAALKALTEDGYDFVYIHVEAPDEMGHQGSVERKVQAIEYLDEKVIKPMVDTLNEKGVDFRMLVLPDHPTPICVRTHTSDSVPYMLYDSTNLLDKDWNYNEDEAKTSGNYIEKGHEIIDYLFSK